MKDQAAELQMLATAEETLAHHQQKVKEWTKIIHQLRTTLSLDDFSQTGIRQLNEFMGVEIEGSGKNGRVLRNDYAVVILKKAGRPMSTAELFKVLSAQDISVSAKGSLHTSMRQDRTKRFKFDNGTWTLNIKGSR